MKETLLIDAVRRLHPESVLSAHAYRGDQTVVVRREALLELARTLRDQEAFRMNFLIDITAVDYSEFGNRPAPAFFPSSGVTVRPASGVPEGPDEEPWPGPPGSERFAVVYHFFSHSHPHKHRLRVVVPLEEDDAEVDSLTSLWGGANWLEREVWDMYGIRFKGHPNLKRILMYEEFEGHPLRKDYPVNRRQPLIGPQN
jgi:NADH-quinone oxidoreductase subunit C